MNNYQNIFVATSLNQAKFCKNIINDYKYENNLLLYVDCREYNEIPDKNVLKFINSENKEKAFFSEIVYLNKIFNYSNSNGYKDPAVVSRLLSGVVNIQRVNRIFVSLLSADIYILLLKLFNNSKISIYSDGLMSFGPARYSFKDEGINQRIDSMFYENFLFDIEPLYLRELKNIKCYEVKTEYIENVTENNNVLIALQSLSYSGIFTPEEEEEFYSRYLNQLADLLIGCNIYVLPHPNSEKHRLAYLNNFRRIKILSNEKTGEEYINQIGFKYVISSFSTLLFRAQKCGIKCLTFGTDEILLNLKPLENSNRIPTILARYSFYNYDGLTKVKTISELESDLANFKPNVDKIRFILKFISIIIKPALENIIGTINNADFCKLDLYERSLLLSSGAYKNKPKHLDFQPEKLSLNDNTKIKDIRANQLKEIQEKNKNLEARIKKLKNSVSWKITLPIRWIGRITKS